MENIDTRFITPENRMTLWRELPSPKPDWETFKRLLQVSDWNAFRAHENWLKPIRDKLKQSVDTDAPRRLIDRFIIFVECAPADNLCDWNAWMNR